MTTELAAYCTESNRDKSQPRRVHYLGGRYVLVIDTYKTEEGCWSMTRGRVYNKQGELLADVVRNYCSFWHCYVQAHPNGHDYLLCGEDYQGQTVVELDTGRRKDYLPEEAKHGVGFCWIECEQGDDEQELHVTGCVWGCPYERAVYEFKDPMSLPYPEKSRESEEEDGL